MDGNIYQNSPSSEYPPYAPDLFNGGSNEIMPPVAPSYRHLARTADINPAYYSEQQALNRLMDSVHQSRIEDVRIGQDTVQFYLEDAQVVHGAIEIRARIIPQPGEHLEKREHSDYIIPAPNQFHPQYSYQYPNQLPSQYPYQYLNQLPAPSQYSNQYPYQYPNQLPVPSQYSYQYPIQYLNQVPLQYPYLYRYPNQFPSRYLYQFPVANAAGSIAGAISQLVLTANLLRR